MKMKLLTTALVPLFLASTAFAQSGQTSVTVDGSTMGHAWTDAAADTFFSDGGTMSVRNETEIRARWDQLSEVDRATVRADCAGMDWDSGSALDGAAATTGGEIEGGTAPTSGGVTAESAATTTGGTDATSGTARTVGDSDVSADATTSIGGGSSNVAAGDVAVTTGGADATTNAGAQTVTSGTHGAPSTAMGIEGSARQSIADGQVTMATWQKVCSHVGDL